MIEECIKYLLKQDPFFFSQWTSLPETEKLELIQLHKRIEAVGSATLDQLPQLQEDAFKSTKRLFVSVQELEFLYSRIPQDWAQFAKDKEEKSMLFEKTKHIFDSFRHEFLPSNVRLYGGIKSDSSIDDKLFIIKDGDAVQRNVLDLWDLVRFRLIAPDLNTLLKVGHSCWEIFFDKVLRCRNYYYRPKGGFYYDPYRAIHFQIEIVPKRMVELQLQTHVRESICWLDYLIFKKNHKKLDKDIGDWIKLQSIKANIFEAAELDGKFDKGRNFIENIVT
ncbi:MAG: hypothetical protein K8R85_00385 [Bacteroidetes bacterium]|nr:hypothetical protein [Bacteroidota bacterium]